MYIRDLVYIRDLAYMYIWLPVSCSVALAVAHFDDDVGADPSKK